MFKMLRKNINRSLLTLSALVVCGLTTAQDDETNTIQRDVDVVNTYQPTLRRAMKLRMDPEMDDTMSYKPQFKYVTLNRVTSVTTKPEKLEAADMAFPAYKTPYNWLLQGAVGNSPNLFGNIFYNLGNSKDNMLSVNAGHLAMLGKVKMEDDTKVKAPQNDTWAGLDGYHFSGNNRLGYSLKFKNSAYRYYGLNTIDDTKSYLTEDGASIQGDSLLENLKQRNTAVDLYLSFANKMRDPLKKFTFVAGGGVGFFGNKSGVHQTDVRFDGSVRVPVSNNSAVDGDVAVNYFRVHEGDADLSYLFYERHGLDINIAPHFVMDYDFMHLSLGLKIIALVGDEYTKDDFIVHPDLNVDFYIGDGSVRFYAGILGDFKQNSYVSLVEENRYVSPDTRKYKWSKKKQEFVLQEGIYASEDPIAFKAGVRAAFCRAVQLHVGFDYHSLGDEVFFVNRCFFNAADSADVAYSSQFALLQDDGKRVRVHAELNVRPTDKGSLNLSGTYYKYTMDYLEEAWNKPTFEVSLTGRFQPTERLKCHASASLEGQRYALNPATYSKETLKSYVDLNLGANYYISNRWTCFLDVNNITCSDQKRWFGYSSYRINAMAGITYKF